MIVAKEIFLTKGVGRHREKLSSFELALRNAGIAHFNLVSVSSIFPPHCKLIPRNAGLAKMQKGQIAFTVISRNETQEPNRLITASIGLAIPVDRERHGYLTEHHDFGKTEDHVGDYAEDLAASMLATSLGLEIDLDKAWSEKKAEWKISGYIYRTCNVTQSARGDIKGLWTSVVAAAVLITS